MNRAMPITLTCVSVGILAGFVSCSRQPQSVPTQPSQAIAKGEQPEKETPNADSPSRRGDAEEIYLKEAVATCTTQIEFNQQVRAFQFWDDARQSMAKDGKSIESHLYQKLDGLFESGRSQTRGKTFGGDAKAQNITRPITGDLAALFTALDYASRNETPPAPQVQLGDCLDKVDALLNEVL